MMADSSTALMAQAQASAQNGAQNNISARVNSLTDGHIKSKEEAIKSGEEFESMFLGQMLNHMFSGIETNEMFHAGRTICPRDDPCGWHRNCRCRHT